MKEREARSWEGRLKQVFFTFFFLCSFVHFQCLFFCLVYVGTTFFFTLGRPAAWKAWVYTTGGGGIKGRWMFWMTRLLR